MTVKCLEEGCLCTKSQLGLKVKISWDWKRKKAGWEDRGDKASCKATALCFSHSQAAAVKCHKDLSLGDCCFLTFDKRQKQKPGLLFSSLTARITNCSVASPHDSTPSLVNLCFSQSWVQDSNQSRTDSHFSLTLLGILELEPKTYKRAAILLWVLWSAPPHCLEPRNLIPSDHRLVLGHLWLIRLERLITDCQELE